MNIQYSIEPQFLFCVPVNRLFPLRSNSDEGPLLEGLLPGSGVGISVVAVVVTMVVVVSGGRVASSSGNNTSVS